MAKVDHCYPTLESDTQKQIQTLLLNVEQWNAINDKSLKKIITGGYGSGKSIVGKEIVKNCITQNSENPSTLYYICCNHFSLYECHMKEFVDGINKTSNITVVCDSLYNLWKSMCQNKSISNKYISLPKLLEHLASINSNKVCFILEELSEEYVKKEDAIQLKYLFTSILKDSLVVFIPESITKNRELVTNKQKHILQKNFFRQEIIGMKVISLNKSMRVTECNKLLIDIAQKTICETKSVLNIPNKNFRILQENKKSNLFENENLQNVEHYVKDNKKVNDTSHFDTIKITKNNNYASVNFEQGNRYASKISNDKTFDNYSDSNSNQSSEKKENKFIDTVVKDFHDIDLDYMAKIITTSTNNINPNIYMETEYVFKSGIIGHSIKGQKPKVVYLPFYDITDKRSVKVLSIMLEKLCFNALNGLRKTVVICKSMEEVISVAYAIDIIKNFKAVTYSPHLQKYSPSLETKFQIKKQLRNDMDILVTDCKGFSGEESESVIVFVSPEETYLRHVLVDAISRSNSYLTVFVKSCSNNNKPLNKDKTIKNVLTNWSKEFVEKITIATSNTENRKSTDVFFVINENCKVFIDRGSTNDFEKYKKKLQFQIFHENNFIYETMVSDLSSHVKKEFKKGSQSFSENIFPRDKILREIQHYFLQDANKSTLVLYGMSGVGKTLIARKYCEISYNFYKNFVWIDAAFRKLQNSFRNQCQILGFKVHDSKGDYFNIKVIVEKIHNYYKNENTLYIFDNVDDKSVKNLSIYISRKPNSFTLITSQWRTWTNDVNKIHVDIFSLEEALAYVKNNIKENTDENIKNLIKELGYHPFAITQAIKYINIHKISIEKYIDRYRLKPSEILDTNNFPTEEVSKSAMKAINLILIKLEKSKDLSFQILNCLSHCDGQNISKQFITNISNHMKINDDHLVDEAIELLMSYSLLNCFYNNKYAIHELTQLSCRCFQKRRSSTNMYLDLIENYFKVELNEVKSHMDYGNHFVYHFIYMFRTNKKKLVQTFHLMTTSIKRLLVCKGLFKETIEILQAIQRFNTEIYGENNEFTLRTKHNIAECLNNMGKYNEALEFYYSVDKIRTEILGVHHPDTLATKHSIALCLYNMGKYNEALEFYYFVDKIRTEILSINHPDTLATKHNIALCLNNMGKYNETLEIYYSVDKVLTEILGVHHPDTMATKHSIALCLYNMGKYNEALEFYYSVDKIRTEILSINHPDTLAAKHNIALCLYNMGKYNEALEFYYSVDKIRTESLGMNHPNIMSVKNNIALCLNKMGKYNEALEIYYLVYKIRTEILGINHPDTVTTKHNIALCLNNMGKYNEALEIYYYVDKIRTEILGINHPDTKTTKHNIALCLNSMGKYNEAL
ncbi:uncharacterized protein LOC124810518 [Hydra vulgaris]|uniref:uncharacterized protein LOC124810518 n=1 Tax=Hydra vulgaris TaxID=6087 RepID=UPI001F5F41AB|nr:uncharacterized protein LOC124810518 [Hydra vulgaris]